jgi:hypothetical protein
MSKNSTVTNKYELKLFIISDYLRALYHPVPFIVLKRNNGIWMAKCRGCERKRYCSSVARETEEKHEELVMTEDMRVGFDRSIFWIQVSIVSRVFEMCVWVIHTDVKCAFELYTPTTNLHSLRYCTSLRPNYNIFKFHSHFRKNHQIPYLHIHNYFNISTYPFQNTSMESN